MVETRRSQRSAAAAGPGAGGGGSDGEGGDGGGKGGRGRGKRPASSASTTNRGKDEAPEQKETPAAPAAAGKSLGSREADKMGQRQPVLNPPRPPPPPPQRNPRRPWARLLSQHPEIAHFLIYADGIRIGRDVRCHIVLGNQASSGILCMLRRLQQGGPCELEFTGQNGLVVLNEKRISPGDKVSLIGGDELIFGAKDAYIFQHPLRDTEVTKAVQISAVNSADTELSRWITFKDRMKHGILNPNDIDVTLDNFPYYLSEITKKALLSPAFVHSKKFGLTFPEILSLNPRILLSGPSGSETYLETLVKALAKDSEARLLIADSLTLGSSSLKDVRMDDVPCTSGDIEGPSNLNTFREGDRVEYTGTAFKLKQSGPAYGSRGKVVLAFEKNQLSKLGVRFNNPITHGNDLGGLCEINNGFFCHAHELRPDSSAGEEVDSVALGKLIEVISEESKGSNLIVLLKDVQKLFTGCRESHASLIRELPPGVLIIGSHTQTDSRNDQETYSSKKMQETLGFGLHETDRSDLSGLFRNKITIELPQNEAQLSNLKKQLERDTETLKANANVHNIRKFLTSRKIECNDLQELSIKDQLLTNESVDKIVGLAISHHFQQNKPPSDGKIILPIKSLKHGFSMLQNTHSGRKSSNNILKDVVTENYFEETILKNVISPNETGVTFEDIGALDNVKETLRELVMLPLQRPELFSKGQLRKPVKGILLFGPPGTGKTMLAKAVATEAGANFINVSISSIMSKWLGESEKYVKAIFSLASKIAPAVIFVDEVDSLLAMRGSQQEHEAMRKVKNEFMVNWDGLRTKEQERVLVLGTTNRPHDLDEAVIRRFSRRIMVDLPDASNREKILKVILSKETLAPDVDLGSVANMTEGYSGSDLKNLCITAAHGPVREITENEKKEKSLAIAEGKPEPPLYGGEDVRPLGMVDLKLALDQVGASLSTDSVTMSRIVQWNNEFGDGGSRRKEPPFYML